jgi:hypothetical protein
VISLTVAEALVPGAQQQSSCTEIDIQKFPLMNAEGIDDFHQEKKGAP